MILIICEDSINLHIILDLQIIKSITKKHYALNNPNSCYKYMTTNFERDARKQVNILSKPRMIQKHMIFKLRCLPNLFKNRQMKKYCFIY